MNAIIANLQANNFHVEKGLEEFSEKILEIEKQIDTLSNQGIYQIEIQLDPIAEIIVFQYFVAKKFNIKFSHKKYDVQFWFIQWLNDPVK
jgi:hypothetical protein